MGRHKLEVVEKKEEELAEGFNETSSQEEEEVSPDAILTERERSYRDAMLKMQSDYSQRFALVDRELKEIRKKTGVKTKVFESTEVDGQARIAMDFSKKIIVAWKMKEGTTVYLTPSGEVVDNQTIIFTNEDGETKEMPYRQFYRMVTSNRIPCRIKNYLRRDENGFFRAVKAYRPDDLVKVIPGIYQGDPEDGVIAYGEKELDLAYRYLNP